MNRILVEIKKTLDKAIHKYLPDVTSAELEENGAVYYMNGKNGTEFDWYVNEKLSDFMVFYNDVKNLGAAKATLYEDGGLLIYIYGEKGAQMVQEIKSYLEVSEKELFLLAVLLRREADDRKLWDASIEQINTDMKVTDGMIEDFTSNVDYYDGVKRRKAFMGQMAYVSKKILEEGWKVGYMIREETDREGDSGWQFLAGNEGDAYLEDYQNIALMSIYEVYQLDPAIWNYIDHPVGSSFIRISSREFEPDHNDKEIYMEKRLQTLK